MESGSIKTCTGSQIKKYFMSISAGFAKEYQQEHSWKIIPLTYKICNELTGCNLLPYICSPNKPPKEITSVVTQSSSPVIA